jgi:hypothetical protein
VDRNLPPFAFRAATPASEAFFARAVRSSGVMPTAALAAPGFAQRIQQRGENQQRRIATGVASGSLTAAEAARLERREARLNREIARDRRDSGGRLTPAERRRVNRAQNRLSRQIYRQKHDAQRRR